MASPPPVLVHGRSPPPRTETLESRPPARPVVVRVIYLPLYSPDLNPIEPGWALQKQYVRRHAPRHPLALRRVARRARFRVTVRHAEQLIRSAGYWAPLR